MHCNVIILNLLFTGSLTINFALCANRSVLSVSLNARIDGETAKIETENRSKVELAISYANLPAITNVLELPPNESFKIQVNTESRYGIKGVRDRRGEHEGVV